MIRDIIKYCSLGLSLVLLGLGILFLFLFGTTVGVGILILLGVVFVCVAGFLFQPPKKPAPKNVKMAREQAEKKKTKRVQAAHAKVSVKPREGYSTNYDEVQNKNRGKTKKTNKNICPHCKYKKNWPDDHFCQNCGAPLK